MDFSNPLLFFLSFYFLWLLFWLLRTINSLFFWLYLWQLKEYHWGRFKAHFQTYKGKRIFLNPIYVFKIILLFFAFNKFLWIIIYLLFFIYFLESILILRRKTQRPVWTPKMLFLFFSSLVFTIFFFSWTFYFSPPRQFFLLFLFDLLLPIFITLIVFLFQPFVVLIRKYFLKKAREKIEKLKKENQLKIVAITGSYGKTSTKEFLSTILSKKYNLLSTKLHQNSEIAIAQTILKELNPSHQIFIAEVGAYNKGKVKEVCEMIKPDIGMVTGVNEQHLALFGSFQNLLSAEGGRELSESLSKNGILIVNGENKYCLELLKTNELPSYQERIYALSNKIIDSDVWIEDAIIKEDKISFVVMNKKKEMASIEAKIVGRHNIQNLLGAILVANELGMSLGEISEACELIKPEQSGLVLKQGKYGIKIIDSSYSSNPDGVIADLEYLSLFSGKKVIVMPCLIELGIKAREIHELLGQKIGQVCDLAILTTRDYFKEIKKGIEKENKKDKVFLLEKPKEIFSKITTFCTKGDVVLLEGRVPRELIDLLIE